MCMVGMLAIVSRAAQLIIRPVKILVTPFAGQTAQLLGSPLVTDPKAAAVTFIRIDPHDLGHEKDFGSENFAFIVGEQTA